MKYSYYGWLYGSPGPCQSGCETDPPGWELSDEELDALRQEEYDQEWLWQVSGGYREDAPSYAEVRHESN